MRVQRLVARSGVASRRAADALVAAGRVTINGRVAKVGESVDPATDSVAVDGVRIGKTSPVEWLVLNKPQGTLTTHRDPGGRPTVFDLLPRIAGLTYVGRLDYLTEGLLLLTNDGHAADALTHPSSEIERTYEATVRGDARAAIRALREGLELDDGPVHVIGAYAEAAGNGRWLLEIVLTEGRNREVRRICELLDLDVERLVRTAFGPIRLGKLETGSFRPLSPHERRELSEIVRGTARGARSPTVRARTERARA